MKTNILSKKTLNNLPFKFNFLLNFLFFFILSSPHSKKKSFINVNLNLKNFNLKVFLKYVNISFLKKKIVYNVTSKQIVQNFLTLNSSNSKDSPSSILNKESFKSLKTFKIVLFFLLKILNLNIQKNYTSNYLYLTIKYKSFFFFLSINYFLKLLKNLNLSVFFFFYPKLNNLKKKKSKSIKKRLKKLFLSSITF